MSVQQTLKWKQQKGISVVGGLFVALFFGTALMFAASLFPVWLSHNNIESVLKSLADDPGITKMTVPQLRTKITKAFQINGVSDEAKKNLKVKKQGDKITASIQYEVRDSLLLNIDIVSSWHSVLYTDKPELCCKPIPSRQ